MPRWEPVWKGLVYAAEEMGAVLRRTAVSPNIRDRLDYSCAVLDARGRLIAQAEHIPVHLGVLAYSGPLLVKEALEAGAEEGDVLISNDPYLLGTHLNDVTLVKPVYYDGRLVAWLAVKAHHVDVGGVAPGSIGGASRIDEEGAMIHLEFLTKRGRLRWEAVEPIERASRTPGYIRMDIHAQLAALERGERLVAQLIVRYGLARFETAVEEAIGYVERFSRRIFGELEGCAEATDYLEDDESVYPVKAKLCVEEGIVTVELESPHQLSKPINSTLPSTVAAVAYTLKAVLEPELPVNHGLYETLRVAAEPGTVLNAKPPAPVSAYTETVQRVVDVVQAALAELAPGRVPAASCGTMTSVAIGGEGWAFYETIGCGSGARPSSDGVDGVHVNMTNTLNTPIEVIEEAYPVTIEEYSLRADSCGLGRWRGGLGIRRVYKIHASARVSIAGSRVKTRPWGLEGGEPAQPAAYTLMKSDGRIYKLPPLALADLKPGDVLIVETPGGGGYGDPCERPRGRLEEDIVDEKLSRERMAQLEEACRSRLTER